MRHRGVVGPARNPYFYIAAAAEVDVLYTPAADIAATPYLMVVSGKTADVFVGIGGRVQPY